MHELIYIPYSPWSEKARWALDAHRVPHRARVYTPMLGEPALRLRLRSAAAVSVPVLIVGDRALRDSWDIALWSAHETDGEPLISPATQPLAEAWNATCDRALDAGRARTTRRVMSDSAALAASVPPPMNRLGPATQAIGWLGARWLHRRYCDDLPEEDALRSVQRAALEELRASLDRAGGDYLAGAFSYADVCAAVMLHFVSPPEPVRRILAPVALACWHDEELAAEFSDVLSWRDRLYERHRDTSAGPTQRL